MNCDGVRELLSAYVDGELSPGELLRVEQHLRRCPLCAEEVDALRQAIAYVGALEEVELPAGFREGLRARLAQVSPQLQPVAPVTPLRPAWHRQVKRWALPAAAAAAFALATSGAYGTLGPLLTKVADQTPTGPVKPPVVEPAPNPTQGTNPPPVASNTTDPVTNPGPVTTDPPPVTTTDPVTPPPQKVDGAPAVADNPVLPPPFEATGGGIQVASLTDQVSAPSQLPAQIANRTTVQAIVVDPTSSCNALKSAVASAECSIKEAGRRVEVRFQVAVGQAAADAFGRVTSILGEAATVQTEGIDRAPQLQASYDALVTIQEDTLKLALAVETAKDASQRQVEEAALARKVDEGKKAVEDYNRLVTEVNSQLFVIDLQKQGQ